MDTIVWLFKQIAYLSFNASILALTIILVKKIFNKTLTPKYHYYIWILLIVRLLLPIYIESPTSIYNLFSSTAKKINLPQSVVQNISRPNNSADKSKISLNNTTVPSNNFNIQKQKSNSFSLNVIQTKNYNLIIKFMCYIWLIGIGIMLIYTLYINTVFVIKLKHYEKSKNTRIASILKSCQKLMHVRRNITILTTNRLRTPSLYGFLKVKILISEAYMKNLSDDEIKYIFLHELSHYKRKDILLNWIIVLLQIIHFFNPIIWYAFYKIHEDCEISCDAAALKYVKKEHYQDYGSTIIKLLRLFSESNFIPVTAGISKNKSSYKRRIIMISNFKKSSRIKTFISLTLIAAIAITGLTSCGSVAEKSPLSINNKMPTKTLTTNNKTSVADNNTEINNTKQTAKIKSNTNITNASQETATNINAINVSSKVKLYEGTYFDDQVYKSVDHLLKEYYEIAISNVKDTSFDFTIYKVIDSEKKIKKVVFLTSTAVFTDNGTKAAFYGKNYTLHFTFPNYHHAYPIVTDMEVSGFKELEGKTYVNNAIPGHEFG